MYKAWQSEFSQFMSRAIYLDCIDKISKYTNSNELILKCLRAIVSLLKTGLPIAYILGDQPFYNISLSVWPGVLIPRLDTEVLIDYLINSEHLSKISQKSDVNVLDLGTGSGAIALSLARAKQNWNITAVDNNYSALYCSNFNKNQLQITNVDIKFSNWFENLNCNKKYDLIVSNPPYISNNDPNICINVKKFEPNTALFANNNGLLDYDIICNKLHLYLKEDGLIIFEHGFKQKEALINILKKHKLQAIDFINDLNKNPRAILAKKNSI